MQLRDFLQRSLYDPEQGYFTSSSAGVPVGSIGQPLEFNNLLGQADYLANVKERYIQLQVMHAFPIIVDVPHYLEGSRRAGWSLKKTPLDVTFCAGILVDTQ